MYQELGGALLNLGFALKEGGATKSVFPILEEAIGNQKSALAAKPKKLKAKRFLCVHLIRLVDAKL